MASITLPNIVTGKTITVEAPNLAAAQQAAATATGVSLAAQQGGGTYGTNSFTGGPSGSGGGDGGGGGVATPQVQQGFNVEAANAAAQLANNAAQQEYLRARLNLDTDIEANRKAQQVWQNTFDQAKFEYQKTIDTQQFGISEGNLTGTYKGAPTLAAQSEQNKTALGYLGLIGNLRGPQDYGQYLKVLASTPGGLRDLVSNAAGRYQAANGATGLAPVPVSLGGVLGDVANNGVAGQIGSQMALQSTGTKGVGGTGGVPMPDASTAAVSTAAPTDYAQFQAAAAGLPLPNQIAPQAFNNMTTTQRQLLGSLYESQGWMPQDVTDLYKMSLPKYVGPSGPAKVKLA